MAETVSRFCYGLLLRWEAPLYLDIGASTGSCALATRYLPNAHCIAFEPNPHVCDILRSNLALNQVDDRVRVVCAAAGPRADKILLKIPEGVGESGFAHLRGAAESKQNGKSVPMLTVDSVVGDEAPVRLAKLDVEGYERLVLEGMARTIERDHPIIVLEHAEKFTLRYGYQSTESVRFLAQLGYDHVLELTAVDWIVVTDNDMDRIEKAIDMRARKRITYTLRTDWTMIGPGYVDLSPEQVKEV